MDAQISPPPQDLDSLVVASLEAVNLESVGGSRPPMTLNTKVPAIVETSPLKDGLLGEDGEDSGWRVYMLVNDVGQTYVGIATDIARRIRQHNGEIVGGAKATKNRGPWRLLYAERGFADRREAQSREYYLKKDRPFRRSLVAAVMTASEIKTARAARQDEGAGQNEEPKRRRRRRYKKKIH